MCLIESSPEITTRRAVLRAPKATDAPRIADFCHDAGLARMTSRMPHPYGLSDAEAWIARAQGQDPRVERNFVIDHDDHGVVGMISLFPQLQADLGPADLAGTELGYCVGSAWAGRGLATEAVEGLLTWARRDWKRRAVMAGHFIDNPASGRVLTKAGFLYTGRCQPLFSVARDDWATARSMIWLA
ncbi:MAG: GNAT family N-acetyltransferase [Caulobacterales bacterium]|nr:GNAT family N-acetyltransferase [Caulobacterales bacterium]